MVFSHPRKGKKFIGHELTMKKFIGFSWQMQLVVYMALDKMSARTLMVP